MKHLINLIKILFLIVFFALSFFGKGSKEMDHNLVNAPAAHVSTTIAGSIKHAYDVLNYKLNLNIYNCFKPPYPKSFSANNQITFRVDSTLNQIKLNASNASLVIDSIRLVNSVSLSFSQLTNILTVVLDRTYYPDESVNIIIYYRHNNISDTAFHVNNGLVYTDCEPEGARKWFPCWDKPTDKATTDITAKVPSTVRLGSNGRLADSTIIGDTIYYHWISRDVMSTYLVVITAKTNFKIDIKYWQKISNPQDSVPIRFYYSAWDNPVRAKDTINLITNYFSTKFIEYPFEKIGFATIDSSGNTMENQTLISTWPMSWSKEMVAHEFGHHWFGDLITCGTWADIWLNESFATYCVGLVAEYTHGENSYKSEIRFDSANYFSSGPGDFTEPIYNPAFINNTPASWYLFYPAVRYFKGSCVLYMLRNVLGDSVFFNVLKSYTNDTNYIFKNAVTDDFTAKINQVTSQDYSWFIDEWVKQPGHPVYQNTYSISNQDNLWTLTFLTKQTQTFSPFHTMPLELKVYFSNSSDTVLKVLNNVNNQLFTFYFNKQPDSLQFDPDNKIILRQGTTAIGITKISSEVPGKFALYQNYPNPFNPSTKIKFSLPNPSEGGVQSVRLTIYDLLGKEVETLVPPLGGGQKGLQPGTYEVQWDGTNYPSGVYFYRLTCGDLSVTKKLVLIK
jgi:aminopeptidase N